MQIFSKLKNFNAQCRFCEQVGLVYGAYVDNNKEVAICDECASKLIMGISVAIAQMEKEAEAKQGPIEGDFTPKSPELIV